ncbi:formimidoylglutamase [Halomonas denitrificans]|nr:formimidoylglutamase [Halomonas denitrificans]
MSDVLDELLAASRPGAWPERRDGRFASRLVDVHRDPNPLATLRDPVLDGAGHGFRGVGLIGLADDEGVRLNGGRTGARQGPDAFRTALAGYGGAHSVGLHGLPVPVLDLGNIVPGRSLGETHDRVSAAVAAAIRLGLMPVGIGGGHDLTWPEVRAVIDTLIRPAGRSLHGIYFDAHLDVREEQGSGMPFRRLLDYGGVERLSLFGFDPLSNTPAHLDWFLAHGGEFADFLADDWPQSTAQFVSICLDVIDMSQAPGVSAPAPAGWMAQRVADYAEAAGRQPAVCCFDLMELSPPHDESGRTARLAAHLFLRFLAGLADRARHRGAAS